MKKSILFIAIFLLSVTACRAAETYKVVYVIDGDTVILNNHEHVRLIGIDAPEMRDNDKLRRDIKRTGRDAATLLTMGRKSAEFTRNLVQGKEVRLEYDVQRKDKYSRTLAYVFIPASSSAVETFVNAEIVNAGYAVPYTIPPNVKYAPLFRKLYKEALQDKRGLWYNQAS